MKAKHNTPGGKGSGRRPAQVDEKQLADNWARIFGSTKPRKERDR